MSRRKVEFKNRNGERLAGALELPDTGAAPLGYALFAHCFTCGKDTSAAARIARGLAASGIGVLRFDFTGLGGSEGDFANTDYSSNVADLIAAADFLRSEHEAPTLLIGHSLGGAAVLSAASAIPEVRALCTIGAPATAEHVAHLFVNDLDRISAEGEADVQIGGRTFKIRQQLLDDIHRHSTTDHITRLRAALLVMHSPVDRVVPIGEAATVYQAAKHPKSFVSLDRADHLLTDQHDAKYVATVLGAWALQYVDRDESLDDRPDVAANETLVSELDLKFKRGLHTAKHRLIADEPSSSGGGDAGPDPYQLLLMSLGACTSMTIRMYANHKKIPLDEVNVRLVHERQHADDCAESEAANCQIERITLQVKLSGDLTSEQRRRLLEIADRCPVHRTLVGSPDIVTTEYY